MKNQTTIFITSFFGLIARNILASEMLTTLRQKPNLRIVILTHKEKENSLKKEFLGGNVFVESINIKPRTRWESFFSALFLNSSNTDAGRIGRLYAFKKFGDRFRFIYHGILARLSNFKIFRNFIRFLDFILMPKNKFKKVFEKYQPDIVFSTDTFEPEDIDVMREARSKGIFILGMVRSWDNITTHGLNRIIPDRLIVNTPYIKKEAVFYNDIKPEKIDIVGIPHYDRYVKEKRISREKLFKKLNLDPKKKTILFAPTAKLFVRNDKINSTVIKALKSIEDLQMILRLYIMGNVDIGDTKAVPGKIAIDVPNLWGAPQSSKLSANDSHLADLLYHSDIVIAFASSLAIDAVLFKKPVIFIGFDADPSFPSWKSARRFYGFEHQKSIINTGGVKLAKNTDDFVKYVKQYLENPNLDAEKREKILKDRCWKLDGKSSERLAEVILNSIKHLRIDHKKNNKKSKDEENTGSLYGSLFTNYSEKLFNESVSFFAARHKRWNIDLGWFKGKSCLDAGCGGGRFVVALSQLGASKVVGIDISEKAVLTANERIKERKLGIANAVVSSVLKIPYLDNQFDYVLSSGVIHHTPNPKRAFGELVRVLKPEGKLFLSVYGKGGLKWLVNDIFRYSVAKVIPFNVMESIFKAIGVPANKRYNTLDNLYVPYYFRFTESEIRSWFENAGFKNIRRVKFERYDYQTLLSRIIHGEGWIQIYADKL